MKLLLGTAEGLFGWETSEGLTPLCETRGIQALARGRPYSPRIYAATERQVLRSQDDGWSWEALPKGFEGAQIASLAVHPRDDRHLLAGLESSALFESRDGGESWRELEAIRAMSLAPDSVWHVPWGPARGRVRAPAWDVEEPQRLYLPIEVGGTCRTEEGGATWDNVHGGIHDDVHALAVHSLRNNVLYAATREGFGRSDDFGRSWRRSASGPEHPYCRTIAIDAGDGECLYTAGATGPPPAWQRPSGAETALFRSDDGAMSWQRLDQGLPKPFHAYINALATDPVIAGHVYFVTDAGEMFHSADYGEPWERLGDAPPTHALLVMP